jgi:hypothetical protein
MQVKFPESDRCNVLLNLWKWILYMFKFMTKPSNITTDLL